MNLIDFEWAFYVILCFLVKLKFKIYLFTYTDSAMVSVLKAKIGELIACMRAGSLYKAIKCSKSWNI